MLTAGQSQLPSPVPASPGQPATAAEVEISGVGRLPLAWCGPPFQPHGLL